MDAATAGVALGLFKDKTAVASLNLRSGAIFGGQGADRAYRRACFIKERGLAPSAGQAGPSTPFYETKHETQQSLVFEPAIRLTHKPVCGDGTKGVAGRKPRHMQTGEGPFWGIHRVKQGRVAAWGIPTQQPLVFPCKNRERVLARVKMDAGGVVCR